MSFPKRSEIFKDPIWTIKDTLAKPSLDTFYQVSFSFSGKSSEWLTPTSAKFGGIPYSRKAQNLVSGSTRLSGKDVKNKLMLLCSEAEIPGTSYLTTEARSHYQGITEQFPTFREFPPLNLSFYLDSDHVVLEVFESWMRYINPLSTDDKKQNAYSRFNYPEDYKERLHITKYERDFQSGSKMSQYEFIDVWPTNMTSMRVNYGTSAVVKLSVQLAYDRFFTQFGVIDTNPMAQAFPDDIHESDALVNSNNNRWWNQLYPLGMNDQIRSIQSGFA